jgi:hypothetical protein
MGRADSGLLMLVMAELCTSAYPLNRSGGSSIYMDEPSDKL